MKKAPQAGLAHALRLDPEARAELVAGLLASRNGPAHADASTRDAEIERRIQATESGEMGLEPSESVKRRIETVIVGR